MRRTGYARLYLHYGSAPPWLWERMVRLGSAVIWALVDEYGTEGVLDRLSNTFFFQSMSNALGFDWNSSGTTTVLCGVINEILDKGDYGIRAVGGKGKRSKLAKSQLDEVAKEYCLDACGLKRTSRLTAKVDNDLLQDGYQLYHHSMFVDRDGLWAVVQQGMNKGNRMARRYHWMSGDSFDYIEEPHESIVCDFCHHNVLDLTSKESRDNRKVMLDLMNDNPAHVKADFNRLSGGQKTLLDWSKPHESYDVPRRMNWDAVERVYELQPENFEELLLTEGLGGKTLRGLSLVAELIYGGKASWSDPVMYSFAFGGKDGVPFPIEKSEYDKAILTLEDAIQQSRLGSEDKLNSIKRLRRIR